MKWCFSLWLPWSTWVVSISSKLFFTHFSQWGHSTFNHIRNSWSRCYYMITVFLGDDKDVIILVVRYLQYLTNFILLTDGLSRTIGPIQLLGDWNADWQKHCPTKINGPITLSIPTNNLINATKYIYMMKDKSIWSSITLYY